MAERPRPRLDLAAVFGLGVGGWNWSIAVTAALAMAVTFGLGTYLFSPASGVVAALGSFTVLYERTTPYMHRARALAMIGLGFVGSIVLGSLTGAINLWLAAVTVGVVAAVATWVCQSLRIAKPAAFMFILVCAIATVIPGGPQTALIHAGLAAGGATVGWLGGMAGAVLRRRGPEERAVSAAFRELSELLAAVGTRGQDHAQHEASVAVAEAWRLVLLAQVRGYRDTPHAARLRALLRWVSDIQLTATDVALARHEELDPRVPAFAARLADAVARPDLAPDPADLDELRKGHRPRSLMGRLYNGLARAAQTERRPEHDPEQGPGTPLEDQRRPGLLESLRSGLRGDSLIRATALRMGITVAAAGLLGLALDVDRFYWISITAASVLQGGNVVVTMNRAVQRGVGTLVGVVLAVAILSQHLPLVALIPLAAALQGTAQLLISRNFLYASVILTPMALILAHTANPTPIEQLAQTRVEDSILGALVGLLGALLLWRRASAMQLPQAITETLERSRTAIGAVLDPDVRITPERRYRLRRDLRATLLSLRGIYESAIGDVPRAKHTRPLWPVVVATQRVGFQALAALARDQAPPASHITGQRINIAFSELVSAFRERRVPRLGALPSLPEYPRLPLEVRALSAAMRTAVAEDARAATAERQERERREQLRAQRETDADL
nr:FUSC family protein [Spiractinospora alimapuensis]